MSLDRGRVSKQSSAANRGLVRLQAIEGQLCEDFDRLLSIVQPEHNLKPGTVASLAGAAISRLDAQKVLVAITDRDLAPFDLPPKARTPYSRHWKNPKFGKRLDVETFLTRVWDDLARKHLILTEHLRRVDQPLCQAIAYQAETRGVPLDDFRLSLGILNVAQVLDPPLGLELPAAILRKVLAREQITNRERRLGRE